MEIHENDHGGEFRWISVGRNGRNGEKDAGEIHENGHRGTFRWISVGRNGRNGEKTQGKSTKTTTEGSSGGFLSIIMWRQHHLS
ncbi:MAG: hypothetical protein SOT20_02535 [Candidatus Cryptobacteroides sp.]|nr:hypothetical protein [Candidatus Cryptobacteroides sp.]